MSDEGDLDGVFRHLVPDELAERMLAGEADADDLGDGLARVAGLFKAARQPATPEELGAVDATVAAFTDVVRSNTIPTATSRRSRMRPQNLTGKAAAIVVAATLFSAGAAAAATGNLPDPIQRTVSNSLSHVGVELPNPDDDGASSATSTPVGPDANGPAHDGLCTAYFAGNGKNLEAPAFRNLFAAAVAAGQTVEEFCTPPTTTTTSSTTTTTTVPTTTTSSTEVTTSTIESPPVGPDANGPAKHGLCTAYFAGHGKNMEAIAFRNLADAAAKAGQTIEEFCADVLKKPADKGHGKHGN